MKIIITINILKKMNINSLINIKKNNNNNNY
jgi:hypothetical protein